MLGIKVGEKVMAKWPGSSLWFPAVVTALGEQKDSYEVKFEDGTEEEVAENHVSKEATFRRSRSRSPARKSPSRKRSRSPARKASPSRKAAASPSRKAAASPSRKSSKSPARSPSRKAVLAQTKTTPTRSEKTSQSVVAKRITRSESHIYSTRSATRSGAQTLEPAVDMKSGRVPKTTHYEYGGPFGVLFFIMFLCFVPIYLYFACHDKKCGLVYPNVISLNWRDYYDCRAYEIVLGFVAFQFVLHLIPFGRELRGMPLRNGIRLTYRLNGFLNAVICIALFVTMIYYKCGIDYIVKDDKFLPLLAGTMILGTLLSVYNYIMARRAPGNALSPKGNTGNIIYDFAIGHELNPRPFWDFDLKMFTVRVCSIALILIDIALLAKAWTSFPDNPPYPLLCVVSAQIFYMLDLLYFEESLLTTIYFQCEGPGFGATFGSLVWCPFVFSLQARYLVSNPPTAMPHWCLVPTILLYVAGYIMYRQSMSMKSRFRRNPNARDVADLESIPTSSGKRLLTAGWWGLLRKPNYLGDFMINLSFSLFCGFNSIIPFFHPMFFMFMLIMREREDSIACRTKYGAAWDRYCKRVPYRFIPKIY